MQFSSHIYTDEEILTHNIYLVENYSIWNLILLDSFASINSEELFETIVEWFDSGIEPVYQEIWIFSSFLSKIQEIGLVDILIIQI